MHRTLSPHARASRALSTARRLTAGLAAATVAGALLTGVTATAAQAQTIPSGPPHGNFDGATAVSGGLKVRGWAADADTTSALTVKITVGGATTQIQTGVARPDVPKVFPQFGPATGWETVLPLPTGSHTVCVTVVNVGPGQDKTFPCRTAVVTSGTPTADTATTTARTLTWAPPALTSPTTITISATNRQPRLEAGKDYIIKMPSTPLEGLKGLILSGGRNVVLIGGEVKISQVGTTSESLRGLLLKDQTGTVHIEGLRITGGTLAEGINIDQRLGATVQLQNIRVDTVHGTQAGLHADVIQSWAGPKVLRIDGLTGYTNYQGLFLLPTQFGTAAPQLFDLRNVNIVGTTGSAYLFWRDNGTWPATTQNVWASTSQVGVGRGQYLMGNWSGVLSGKPATGDMVPVGRAGLGYASPGYTR
ncbi:hypothetical protein [Cellulomonas aerilata]|uniref:Right handed beta helix domain-containing protein n=1 Tax=Cellulomonas aerilata TaxID=515326 RepID=A0A512DF50_9CELL|nr:hypothetical protein [Cellulomonas aerilata]GEO35062.1 hypothetical protein CAE01nite_27870 [Cellulomonas aerilata]